MESDSGPLRVLYLEDQESEYNDYASRLNPLLMSLGYSELEFDWAKSTPEFQSKILARPHIVFCDNHIGKNKTAGIRIIAETRRQYPDCLFCLLTSHTIHVEALGAYVPNPDIIISKIYLGSADYSQELKTFFESRLKRSPIRRVDLTFDLKKHQPRHPNKKALTEAELFSMIEQCIDTGRDGKESGLSSVSLSPVPGGASGSGVYELRVLRDGKVTKVPAILKISDRSNAIKEHQNYVQYVKWRLPYTWRVDVLGTGLTGEFGAICYSYAAGGGGSPRPINSFIRDGQLDVIDRVIRTILDSDNQTWYAEDRQTDQDARDYFVSDRFYIGGNRQREEFQSQFLDYLAESARENNIPAYHDDGHFILNGRKYPRPNKLLFSRNWGPVKECVCHGDMNGGNIMYAGGDSSVVFIDFQRTGYWYLFRDFISFESSTRLEFPTPQSTTAPNWWTRLSELIELEGLLHEQGWRCKDLPEYGAYVCRIRQAAHSNFKNEPYELYVFANVIHCLWLFQKASTWGQEKRLRLAAAILAGCEFLRKKVGDDA